MTHQVVYLRHDRALPGVRSQLEAIATAGLDTALVPVFTGGLTKSKQTRGCLLDPACLLAVDTCSQGTEFWVSHEAVLGTAAEAAAMLEVLGEHDAVLQVASSGKRYTWHPAAASLAALVRATAKPQKTTHDGKMSAAALAREAKHRAENAEAWAEAKLMWNDRSNTVLAIEKVTGIKRRSLYHAVERGYLPKRPRGRKVASLG